MKGLSPSHHPPTCPMMRNIAKKSSQGLLTASNPREEDRGSTYLGMQPRKSAVPEASTRPLDIPFLPVVLFDPPFKYPTREKEGPMCEVDRTGGNLTRTVV